MLEELRKLGKKELRKKLEGLTALERNQLAYEILLEDLVNQTISRTHFEEALFELQKQRLELETNKGEKNNDLDN